MPPGFHSVDTNSFDRHFQVLRHIQYISVYFMVSLPPIWYTCINISPDDNLCRLSTSEVTGAMNARSLTKYPVACDCHADMHISTDIVTRNGTQFFHRQLQLSLLVSGYDWLLN